MMKFDSDKYIILIDNNFQLFNLGKICRGNKKLNQKNRCDNLSYAIMSKA